jgi:hypothetical protein
MKTQMLIALGPNSDLDKLLDVLKASDKDEILVADRLIGFGFDFKVLFPIIRNKVMSGHKTLVVCPNSLKGNIKKHLDMNNFSNNHITIISYTKFLMEHESLIGEFDYAIFHENNYNPGKTIDAYNKFKHGCRTLVTKTCLPNASDIF